MPLRALKAVNSTRTSGRLTDAWPCRPGLFRAEFLLHLGRPSESAELVTGDRPTSAHFIPLTSVPLYERALACLLAGTGDIAAGRLHRDRAQRILEGLRNTPALIELSRSWDDAREARTLGRPERRAADAEPNAGEPAPECRHAHAACRPAGAARHRPRRHSERRRERHRRDRGVS